MNAPQSPSLPERVLAQIAKASGQRPARAADVLALVGGEGPAFWAAVEQLYRERRINTAHIQKAADPAPWLALWPAGLSPRSAGWTGASHAALFVKPRADDLFQAYAPRTTPKPAVAPKPAPAKKPETKKEPVMDMPTNTPRARGTLQACISQHMAGRVRADALSCTELANLLCDTPQNIRFAVKALVKKGVLATTERKNGGRVAEAYYDAATERSDTPAPVEASPVEEPAPVVASEAAAMLAAIAAASAGATPKPEAAAPLVDRRAPQPLYRAGDLTVMEIPHPELAAPVAPDDSVHFALWDDGTLTIADGDDVFQYGPAVTRRLALLLGVPGAPLFPQTGA